MTAQGVKVANKGSQKHMHIRTRVRQPDGIGKGHGNMDRGFPAPLGGRSGAGTLTVPHEPHKESRLDSEDGSNPSLSVGR